jgi:uncharacterized protein with HEPN domain
MSPRDLVYVGHMLDMARKAVIKTQGLSREAYDADENLRLALIHLIQVIGEAARQRHRSSGDTGRLFSPDVGTATSRLFFQPATTTLI